MSTAAAFERLWREEQATLETLRFTVLRSEYLFVWRWQVLLFMGGNLIDQTLCVTRRRAERYGRRWVADERMRVNGTLLRLARDLGVDP